MKYFTIFRLDKIQYHHNSTLVMGKVECILGLAELLLGFLGGSVLTVDMDGVANKIWVTSGFRFEVMLVGSLSVSGTYILQLSCVP